jgi:hypothetical protein
MTQSVASLCAALAYLPVANYLAVYAASFSSSTTTINLVVGLFNLAACGGSMLAGRISDYSFPLALTLIGLCGALLSLTAWGLADTLGKVYAFAVLFGLTGQQTSTWGGVTKDLACACIGMSSAECDSHFFVQPRIPTPAHSSSPSSLSFEAPLLSSSPSSRKLCTTVTRSSTSESVAAFPVPPHVLTKLSWWAGKLTGDTASSE